MSNLPPESLVDIELLEEFDTPLTKPYIYEPECHRSARTTAKAVRRPRRPLPRFPRAAVRILEQWLLDHRDAPYATQHEQDELKLQTGLKRSQIMNWFANARKRGKIQTLQLSPSPSQQPPAQAPMPLFPQVANLHPFERWLHLGLEHEAASSAAIQEALSSYQMNETSKKTGSAHRIAPSQLCGTSTNWQYFRQCGSSVSSLEIRSYAANAKSVSSDQWRHHEGQTHILTKSARRHRRLDTQNDGKMSVASVKEVLRKFQCTFCNDSFKKKHDWQRHEKSQHLPLEKWICCPQGSVNVDPATNEVTCAFCGMLEPDPEHIQSHGYTQCISRSSVERTFYRKDHLRQHLRLMHNDCPMMPSMEAWKSAVNNIRSRCGFCMVELTTWGGRVEHLAEHFRGGAQMSDWDGDWGFESEILEILEREILPSARRRPRKKAYETLPPVDDEVVPKTSSNRLGHHLLDNFDDFDNDSHIYDICGQPDNSFEVPEHFEHSSIQCSSIFDSFENMSSLDELFYENTDLEAISGHVQTHPAEILQNDERQQVQACALSSKVNVTSSEVYATFDTMPQSEFGFDVVSNYASLPFEIGGGCPLLFDGCTEDGMQACSLYELHNSSFPEQHYI